MIPNKQISYPKGATSAAAKGYMERLWSGSVDLKKY